MGVSLVFSNRRSLITCSPWRITPNLSVSQMPLLSISGEIFMVCAFGAGALACSALLFGALLHEWQTKAAAAAIIVMAILPTLTRILLFS
jgi:hypothetical protein